MKVYVVVCKLRRSGVHAESVHREKADAIKAAEKIAESLRADTAERFGSRSSIQRYQDSWVVDGGETGTVEMLEAEMEDVKSSASPCRDDRGICEAALAVTNGEWFKNYSPHAPEVSAFLERFTPIRVSVLLGVLKAAMDWQLGYGSNPDGELCSAIAHYQALDER